MPKYTSNYNLYKPDRADSEQVDVTLSDNFEKIDTEIKSRKDEIDAHKSATVAHESKTIVHGEGTVESAFTEVNSRVIEVDQRLTTTANEARDIATETQSQFDRVVAEAGSNNPEVVQARGTEVNLNARLDKFTTQLAQTSTDIGDVKSLSWLPPSLTKAVSDLKDWYYQKQINVRTPPYNAKGDGSSDDTSIIQQVFNDAKNNGTEIYFPKGTYNVSLPIDFDFKGVRIKGTGQDSVIKATQELNGGIFRSIQQNRVTNVNLERVIIEDIQFNLNKFANTIGIQANGFTRGCSIDRNHFSGVAKAAISLSGSWSFSITLNTIEGVSGNTANGIALGDEVTPPYNDGYAVNQAVISNNTVRFCNKALLLKYGYMNLIDGNTFELNNINIENFQAVATTISNNYLEFNTGQSVFLSGTTSYPENVLIVGNFFNAASGGTEIYINSAKNCHVLSNHFRNDNTHIYLASGSKSRVINNYFEVNTKARIGNFAEIDFLKNTVYYYNDGKFDRVNTNDLYVYAGFTQSGATPRFIQDTTNDLAEWVVRRNGVEWARMGKLSSSFDDFYFQGNGIRNFFFNKPVKFGQDIGFFGTNPTTKRTVSGTTDTEKLASLIQALKDYGLIS